MKRYRVYVLLAVVFISLAVFIYTLHYLIFRDPRHIFIFLLSDLAFLQLEITLVILIVGRVLDSREKRLLRQKLNMVVGAFYSEVGNDLLRRLLPCMDGREQLMGRLVPQPNWTRKEFRAAAAFARSITYRPDCARIDLQDLRAFLVGKRSFMLRLIENPNLLEDETFTDLLWATFHLTEELESRTSLADLPAADLRHIDGDIERLYGDLVAEWVSYAEHLKTRYPYLYSLVLRTHPFQENPSPIVHA